MQKTKNIHTEIVTSNDRIFHSIAFDKEQQLCLFEYKFILYKFEHPIHKNIRSIQVMLNEKLPPNIQLDISVYAGSMKITEDVTVTSSRFENDEKHKYELLIGLPYIPSQLLFNQPIQIISHIQKKNVLFNLDKSIDNCTMNNVIINMDIDFKYSNFTDETITQVEIPHSDDIRKLIVKNGSLFILKKT
jgi:hypothetical protein